MAWLARIALCVLLLAASPGPPAGKVEERAHGARKIWVYTPPRYDAAAKTPYDLLIVFDGGEYVEDIGLPKILDRLLAEKKSSAFVAVLIDNHTGADRLADLANRESRTLGGPLRGPTDGRGEVS